MNYRLIIKPSIYKDLKKLPAYEVKHIWQDIQSLKVNPRPEGVVKLHGFKDMYRIRSGKYRVIYSIFDKELIVKALLVAHRKDVYKNISIFA